MVRETAPEKRLLTAAAEVQSFCSTHGWRVCLVGGLAVLRWGRPRATQDVALAGIPFEQRMLDRATPYSYSRRYSLRTASAEDVVVLKAFADRAQDWVDIEGILISQTAKLNWRQIEEELAPLCEAKESPEILDRLQRLRTRLESG